MGGQSEWFTTTLGNDNLIVSANAENIQNTAVVSYKY